MSELDTNVKAGGSITGNKDGHDEIEASRAPLSWSHSGLPVSRAIVSASLSKSLRTSLAKRRSSSMRVVSGMAAHAGHARRACATARLSARSSS
jgi:hypothetical protein